MRLFHFIEHLKYHTIPYTFRTPGTGQGKGMQTLRGSTYTAL